MPLFLTALNWLLYAVGLYLLLNCLYLLLFSLVGHLRVSLRQQGGAPEQKLRKMCVLIPAYRENAVILETTQVALQHAYEGEKAVVVIADGLEPQTVARLQQLGATVLEVAFARSTKGKSLLYALTQLPPLAYEVAVVLDVDNIMGRNFLTEVNRAFNAGYQVVQGHRTAKNTDSAFALLDACNEEINNHIYRKGPFAVGLSSALIGSGMAFRFSYLQQLLTNIGETVGEDKELDFRIARDQQKIGYLHHAYVYDEKVENAQVFTQQRTRWIAAQLEFLKKYAGEGLVQLVRHGNVEFFNKVVQAFLVPRVLLIGVLGVFFLLSLVVPVGPPVGFWTGLLLLLSAALFLALPARLYNRQLFQGLLRLPYALVCMVLALLRVNRAKTSFLATPHTVKAFDAQLDH